MNESILTPQEDLLGHQTPRNFSFAGDGDPRFTERYWYTAHPLAGPSVLLDAGIGYYPNRGVMDVYAGVTVGRRQFNFRASRRLTANPLETTVGPLNLEIELRTGCHHLTLSDNSSGISFDLIFTPTFPVAQEKHNYREGPGGIQEDLSRLTQFGRWTGWLLVEGTRYVLEADNWWGQRDRSWGIRSEMRTDEAKPPVQRHANFFWTWSMFQMGGSAISLFLKEREPGRPYYLSCSEFRRDAKLDVSKREARAVRHELEWADDPLGQSITRGRFLIEFDGGSAREIRFEALPARFYLKGGLYGGFGGWNHGDDKGNYYEQADVWDLDNSETRRAAHTLSDHVVHVTSEGDSGIGISEYGVAPGYPLYALSQRFPAL